MTMQDNKYKFLLLLVGFFAFFLLDIFIGSVVIPLKEIILILFTGESVNTAWKTIILDFRLLKAVTATLAGIALSISGLQMQTVFRNPLAGPYVLGISAGASLGVAIVIMGLTTVFSYEFIQASGSWAIVLAACAGAASILIIILYVSTRVKDIMTVLILGVMFGSATSAIAGILQFFSSAKQLKTFIIWTMGSLGGVGKAQLEVLIPVVLIGTIASVLSVKTLNALLLGESYAVSMGVNIKRTRLIVFFSTSLLAGSVTAFCGPIGFIGIAVPHIARMIFKTANHQVLIWASVLIGAVIMLASDIVSQLPGYDKTLPINSITALIGIPIVIWIIVRKKRVSM